MQRSCCELNARTTVFLWLMAFAGSLALAQAPELATTRTGDEPAKDNLDVFFKVPAKSTIPLHRHTSAERMVPVEVAKKS